MSHLISSMGKFTFGPVPSRRLGFSLGVDALPRKYCTFDCIYCQIGKTTNNEIVRQRFFDPEEIVREIIDSVTAAKHTDVITFSGSGEPTLNADLGAMVREVKRRLPVPVAVITNGSLLFMDDVRADLMEADIVLPSLDAASEDTFRYINRPHPHIQLPMMIEGLEQFRKEYRGSIWLEMMLIKGMNDGTEELTSFKEILSRIEVDRIQLNTLIRPPGEEIESPLKSSELEAIRRFFGETCEVICGFEKSVKRRGCRDWTKMVLEVLARRSLSLDDIVRITAVPVDEAMARLKGMEDKGLIRSFRYGSALFYLQIGNPATLKNSEPRGNCC